jgi:hypothetical protein
VKTAPAQMATRQTKNATVEYRPNLSKGASVRGESAQHHEQRDAGQYGRYGRY